MYFVRKFLQIFFYKQFIKSRKIGLSVEFAMGPLLAAVSALTGKALIRSLKQLIGSSFYVGLVAPPSSGKSAAIEAIMNAIDHMENFLETEKTMLINAPTVEALSKFCESTSAILCKFNFRMHKLYCFLK